MSADLSIVCVTRVDDAVVPLLRKMAAAATALRAEFVVGADGPGARERLDAAAIRPDVTILVETAGLQEHAQDDVIRSASGRYILRLDDDEEISSGLFDWLERGNYRAADNWSFRRAWLYPTADRFIASAPHWPDLQVRLSVSEKAAGWHSGIHPACPHGPGVIATHSAVIEHHKLLIRSTEERRKQVKFYNKISPGAGLPIFYLPEDREGDIVVKPKKQEQEKAEEIIKRSQEIGMPMQQHGEEILAFLEWYMERYERPVRVLEIGTGHGGTAALWCELVVTDQAQVISVDIPLGVHGGLPPADVLERNRRLKARYPQFHAIMKDSQLESTYNEVHQVMGGMFEILLIDGDHRYECAKRDYELYSRLVRKGGVILFHDIADTPFYAGLKVNVLKLWNELKGEKIEFNIHHNEWGGIGVLVKP